LEGRAKVAFNDGEKLDGFFKEGVLHGFARCDGDDDVGAETEVTGFVSIMIHDPYVDDNDFHRDDRTQCSGSLTEKVDCAYWVIIAMV
jgi:hypothetical protein